MYFDDFFMVPRETTRNVVDGIFSINEWAVLMWIYGHTNPMNGRCEVSYKELVEVFRGRINEVYLAFH